MESSGSMPRRCLHKRYRCIRSQYPGETLCLQHLTPCKDSPFRRCNFVSVHTGKRCCRNVMKSDCGKEAFCPIHAKKVVKIRRIARRAKLKKTTVDSLVGASLDLLKGGDCIPNIPVVAASQSLVVGDEASEDSIDDDDEEERIVEMDGTVEDGDAEQDDSDDPLRYAGVYTFRETMSIFRDKLIKLQMLYTEYFQQLERQYNVSRAQFEQKLKSKYRPAELTPRTSEEKKYMEKVLAALKRYNRPTGKDALVRKKYNKIRGLIVDNNETGSSDDQYEPVVVQCTVDGCKKRVLPKTSYCRRHILRDSRQCLYVPCIFSGCDNAVYKFAETKLCLGHYMYAPKMTKRMTNVENEARVVSEGEEEVKCKDETETNRDESVQVAEVCNEVNVEVQEESQP